MRVLYFIIPCGELGSPNLGKAAYSSRTSSATHSYEYLQYFRLSKQRYGCQCLGFLTCAQMLMHAIAHGGCTDTVRESEPQVDSERKIPCLTGDSNPRQYCARLFSRTIYQLRWFTPLVLKKGRGKENGEKKKNKTKMAMWELVFRL